MTENSESRSWRKIIPLDVSIGDVVHLWGEVLSVSIVDDRFITDRYGVALEFNNATFGPVCVVFWCDEKGNFQYLDVSTLDSEW